MTLSDRRSAVRRAGREARRALTGNARSVAEARLHQHLATLALAAASTAAPSEVLVGAYLADDGEPDLGPTVERLRRLGHPMALPMFDDDPSDDEMRFGSWPPGQALTPGRFGIPVPAGAATVHPHVLLVPLVAFDSSLDRMGRGAGFYDRYLAAAGTGVALTVGVAFEAQRMHDVHAQAHDVPLDVIVTELGIRFADALADRQNQDSARAIGKDEYSCV